MAGKLYFIFKHAESPYVKYKATAVWGIVQLIYEENASLTYILDWQWYIDEIADWFKEKKKTLATDELNVLNFENKSIAELRDMAIDREFFFDKKERDEYFEKVDKCFAPFGFHLRGTPTPVYYIGISNGNGEISYYNEENNKYKSYVFDMNDFISTTENALNIFFGNV